MLREDVFDASAKEIPRPIASPPTLVAMYSFRFPRLLKVRSILYHIVERAVLFITAFWPPTSGSGHKADMPSIAIDAPLFRGKADTRWNLNAWDNLENTDSGSTGRSPR